MNEPKKIGIDCWFACYKQPRGIGKVTQDFLEALSNTETNHYFFLFVPFENDFIQNIAQNPKFIVVKTSENYLIHEQLCIPWISYKERISIIHSLANTTPLFLMHQCERLINIHDTIFLDQSLGHQISHFKLGDLYRRINILITKHLKRTRIFTPSDYTQNKVRQHKICDNVFTIYNGFNLEKYSKTRITPPSQEKFILSFGALDQRKNTLRLINCFIKSGLNNHGIRLRIVGLQSIEEFCRVNKLNLHEVTEAGVTLSEWVSEDTLTLLYQQCLAFIYISLNEGFGLPIIEAELNGARVITSNTTSCAEIGSPYVSRVNPTDDLEITQTLISLLNNQTNKLASDKQWVRKFGWQTLIKKYIQHYET
mgnify:CR=1 FL=1